MSSQACSHINFSSVAMMMVHPLTQGIIIQASEGGPTQCPKCGADPKQIHRMLAGKLQELHTASASKAKRLEGELASAKRQCTETSKELQQRSANNDTLQVV